MGWGGGWVQNRTWVCNDPECGTGNNFWYHRYCHGCSKPWYHKPVSKKGPGGILQGSKWAEPSKRVGNSGGPDKVQSGKPDLASKVQEILEILNKDGSSPQHLEAAEVFKKAIGAAGSEGDGPDIKELKARKKNLEEDKKKYEAW